MRPDVRYFGREGQEIVIEENRYIHKPKKKGAFVNEKDGTQPR